MKNRKFRFLCTAGVLTAVLCIQAFAAGTSGSGTSSAGTSGSGTSSAGTGQTAEGSAVRPGGGAKLTSEWYGKLHAESENFAFSPYSLRDCFRILYPAAAGQSKEEIESILGLDMARAEKLKETDSRMIFQDGIGMKAANKAFVNGGVIPAGCLHPEVLDADETDTTPFTNRTWETINRFISDHTEEKIRDLVDQNTVTAETASVLVNCIYFKNTWNYEDSGILWKDGKRYRAFRSGSVSLRDIRETDTVDILRLPYLNAKREETKYGTQTGERIEGMDQYALYIICDRDDADGLHVDEWLKGKTEDQLLEALNFGNYEGLRGYGKADFLVPCFEVRKRAELSGLLKDLGMKAPFAPGTRDFEAFAPVGIDGILQETWIRSDNGGTEAAAATAMIMRNTSIRIEDPLPVKHVVADTDLAFFLKNDTADEILFAGRIGDLAEAGEKER